MSSDQIEIPRAHLSFLLTEMDQETSDMLIRFTDSVAKCKDDPSEEKIGMIHFLRASILERIDFLLGYQKQYSSLQNWEKIRKNLAAVNIS